MKMEYIPLTQIEKHRSAWFKKHVKLGMIFEQFIRLNDEALHLFPRTEEERRKKTESLMAMPEFVL